jgi:hypothetical protein
MDVINATGRAGKISLIYGNVVNIKVQTESLTVIPDIQLLVDRICGLLVRVPVYRSRGSGSIPGATRCSEK